MAEEGGKDEGGRGGRGRGLERWQCSRKGGRAGSERDGGRRRTRFGAREGLEGGWGRMRECSCDALLQDGARVE